MAKAVVFVVIATALVLLITLSPHLREQRRGPSLHRRFGYDILHRVPSFDPLIPEIERSREANEQVVQDQNEPEPTTNTSVNDKAPKDGVIDYKELEAWTTQQALDRLDYMTDTELKMKDKNGDRAISFREYLPQFSDHDIERKKMGHGEAGWWLERFNKADTDHNRLLDFSEFRDFLNPQDSQNEELLKWLLTDRLKRIDKENDWKLNFKEFNEQVYNMFKAFAEYETAGQFVPSAEEKFAELDTNKDNFLSVEELMAILRYLYPGEISYAKYYASYLMNEADDDGDGNLSLHEMLNHEFVFYSSVHGDEHEESDDDHDEL